MVQAWSYTHRKHCDGTVFRIAATTSAAYTSVFLINTPNEKKKPFDTGSGGFFHALGPDNMLVHRLCTGMTTRMKQLLMHLQQYRR